MNSAAVFWEAVYDDGTLYREADGGKYGNIDRNRLRSFRLVTPGENIVELFCSNGATGWNLVYRRRTVMKLGVGRQVWFIVGFVPQGPIYAVQPESLQIVQSDHFESSGPLAHVSPIVDEGEHWDNQHMIYRSDAVLLPNSITLPSGYRLKVGQG